MLISPIACVRSPDKSVCNEATAQCVQCTSATETEKCGDKACKVSDGTCTNTVRGSVQICKPCESDSECKKAVSGYGDLECFEMNYKGNARPSRYCLPKLPTPADNCPNQFKDKLNAANASGQTVPACFPIQTLVTCEAILKFKTNVPQCTSNAPVAECGDPSSADGLCRNDTIGTNASDYKCTYRCQGNEDCDGTMCKVGETPRYCCTASAANGCH